MLLLLPKFLYTLNSFSQNEIFVETSTVKKSAAFSKNMLKEFNKSYFSNPHLEMPNIDHGVTLFFKWLSNIRLDRSKCNQTFSLIMLFFVRSRKTNSKHKALSLNWVLAMFFFDFNAKSKKTANDDIRRYIFIKNSMTSIVWPVNSFNV